MTTCVAMDAMPEEHRATQKKKKPRPGPRPRHISSSTTLVTPCTTPVIGNTGRKNGGDDSNISSESTLDTCSEDSASSFGRMPSTPCPSTKRVGLIKKLSQRSIKNVSGHGDDDDNRTGDGTSLGSDMIGTASTIPAPPADTTPKTPRPGPRPRVVAAPLPAPPPPDHDESFSESAQSYIGDCPFGDDRDEQEELPPQPEQSPKRSPRPPPRPRPGPPPPPSPPIDEDFSESIQSYVGDCPFGDDVEKDDQAKNQDQEPPYDKGDHDYEIDLNEVFAPPEKNNEQKRSPRCPNKTPPSVDFGTSFSALNVRRINDRRGESRSSSSNKSRPGPAVSMTQIDLDKSVHLAAARGLRNRGGGVMFEEGAMNENANSRARNDSRRLSDASSMNSSSILEGHDSFGVDSVIVSTTEDLDDNRVAAVAADHVDDDEKEEEDYVADVLEKEEESESESVGESLRPAAPPTRGVSRRSSMKGGQRGRSRAIRVSGEIKIYLPMKNTPVMKRRSISFDKNVQIRPIEPATELADKPEELWIQSEELKEMHQLSMELIENKCREHEQKSNDDNDDERCSIATTESTAVSSPASSEEQEQNKQSDIGRSGDVVDDSEKDCIRGLEALMEADLKMERKYDAWDSVLNEQDLQRVQGTFDDENISEAYRYSTAECSQEALERAKQDEDEVRLYLRGDSHHGSSD